MLFKLLKYFLNLDRYLLYKKRKEIYEKISNEKDIFNYQLEKFNKIWAYSYENFSIYNEWLEKYNLPHKLSSIEELNLFPVLTKKDLKTYLLNNKNKFKNYKKISTGGSSGNILRFPYNKNDGYRAATSMSISRKEMGFSFFSNYIMIWGHSHLLGEGFERIKNIFSRMIKDYFQGITRINAYNLNEKSLLKNLKKIERTKKPFVVSYASYFRLLSKTKYFDKLLKKTKQRFILTSETVDQGDINFYKTYENLEIYSEYGAAETGLIAFTPFQYDNFKVLWDIWIAQIKEQNELLLTSLDEKSLFPLIRYEIGDKVQVKSTKCIDKVSYLNFKKIIGRSNDFVFLKNDRGEDIKVHSELFTHILRDLNYIKEFRIIQNKNRHLIFEFIGNLNKEKELSIRKILNNYLNNALKQKINLSCEFLKVDEIKRTKAGKIKFIERK